MKNEKLKRKHLVTVRLNDYDLIVLNYISEKGNISYSKLFRILLNSYFHYLTNFSDYENK